LPFIAAKAIAERREGHEYIGKLRDDGNVLIQQGTLITVSVQAFGDGAMELIEEVRDSLSRITGREGLRHDGLVFVEVLSPPMDMSETVGTTFEERGHMDVQFRLNRELLDDVGIIEVVVVTGDVNV
jgi:hypothetical protein